MSCSKNAQKRSFTDIFPAGWHSEKGVDPVTEGLGFKPLTGQNLCDNEHLLKFLTSSHCAALWVTLHSYDWIILHMMINNIMKQHESKISTFFALQGNIWSPVSAAIPVSALSELHNWLSKRINSMHINKKFVISGAKVINPELTWKYC